MTMRALFGCLTLTLAAGLMGCQSKIPDTIKIGVAQPISGPLAALGADMRNGVQLAIDELNAQDYKVAGKKVTFEAVVGDDRSDAEEGKRVASKLIEADVRAVIGNLNSGVSIAAAPLYAERSIPQLAISTNPKYTQLGLPTTLRIVANDDQQSKAMGVYSVQYLEGRRFAVIDDGTAYGKGLAELAAGAITNAGKAIELRRSMDDKTTDFADLARGLKTANTDMVLVTLSDFQVVALAEQLSKDGMTDVTIVGGDTLKTDKILALKTNLRGIFATSPLIDPSGFPGAREFIKRFRAKYNADPIYGAHYAYDAMHGIAHAMRRAESAEPKAILAELKRKDLLGPATGGFNFAENGEQRYGAVAVYKANAGRWEQMLKTDSW
jgi:branched-chain amino acid transport system substrate-binding protein